MPAVQDNFKIDAGGTLIRQFLYKDSNGDTIDITGYSARAQVRHSSRDALVISSVPEIDPETFMITMTWTPEQTKQLVDSNYVYALEIYTENDEDVAVLTTGVVAVNQRIIR